MRAKKGTRIATATELLLVEPLVSGSVSVTFSLTLKPGRKNTKKLEPEGKLGILFTHRPDSRKNMVVPKTRSLKIFKTSAPIG